MSAVQKYYPPLSDLIQASAIPGDIHVIEDLVQSGIDLLLGKILYKDLVVEVYSSGDVKYYSLSLLTRSLKLPLFGSGMNLVFFRGSENSYSEFPVILEWRWPVSKYIKRFETQGFSYAPEAFIDILLEMANIDSREDFFNQIVNVFLDNGTNSYLNFFSGISASISNYNDNSPGVNAEIQNIINQLAIIKNEVQTKLESTNLFTLKALYADYLNNPVLSAAVTSINTSAEILEKDFGIVINMFRDVVHTLIGDVSDLKEKFKKLFNLFRSWLNEITIDDVKYLLIPQFAVELRNINLALEFPRKWLNPVIEQPAGSGYYEIDPDMNNLSALEFVAGSLKYSTQNGFEFENQSSFNFQRSMIGKTGLIVEFSGLKVDLSRSYNIPEAINDGRPDNFTGVYADTTEIILPKKWFNKENGQTLKISGKRLLIGTGGISGTILIETINNTLPEDDDYFWFKLGKNPDKAWRLGFNKFDITFKQNAVTASNIKAALEIPKFKKAGTSDKLHIGLEGHLYEDGDFSLTASMPAGINADLFDFVHFKFLTFEMGREDDNFFAGTSCEVWFTNPIMNKLLGDQIIKLPRVRIYSNGHIEIVGGNAFIPVNLSLHLGPIDIAVTGIHFGSYQQEHGGRQRRYNYFGFDGSISLGSLGVDAKGKGIKYYYTIDDDEKDSNGVPLNLPHHSFIRVQTIEIDLVIPGSANPASAIAIIHGAVSIPEPGVSPEYYGEVSLKLPKAKIAGGAAMRLQPKAPAFIVDAFIDLPAPIPLGPVGIYGFRGLIGYRYVAEKEAVGLVSGVDSWYDYYKHPPKGIHITKFSGPERTKNYSFPFSIGAGAVLGTSFDSGTIISIRAMLLLSIPTLFMIEGRASILSARLGLEDSKEPPFFAFIAFGDNSLELGIGADFQMPTSNGWIIDLYAEVQAGFFFNNASRWYVNFGTKQQPISARILTILTAQSYLMLSSKGIEAGARVEFDLNKRFGPAKVHLYAYVEIGGRISFERPQIGGYLALGGMIDIEIWIVGISIGLDAMLSVEAAKPFLLFAELRIRVCVRIIVKVCKSFTIELKWEKDSSVDRSAIQPLPSVTTTTQQNRTEELVKAVHMLTNEVFNVKYFSGVPGQNDITDIIPLDSYIDIKTAKGLIPTPVDGKIGGHTTGAENFTDLVSPESISRNGRQLRQVKHTYSIESIEIKAWNGSQWVDYHPYQAIIQGEDVTGLKIGYWQRSGNQYDTIRLLATTPFSYTQAGEPGWFIPEQYGINPSTLFCASVAELPHCSNVLNKAIGTIYYPPQQYFAHYINGAYYTLTGGSTYDPSGAGIAGLNGDYMKVTGDANPFGFVKSLAFNNYNSMQILLPDPSVSVNIRLTTSAAGADISYYKKLVNNTTSAPQYQLLQTVHKTAAELTQPLSYQNITEPVSKVVIAPASPNPRIAEINAAIAALFNSTYENSQGQVVINEPSDLAAYQSLLAELARLTAEGCTSENRLFFSNFYGYPSPEITRMDFTNILKLGGYYIVTATTSMQSDVFGANLSTILKINGKGEIVTQKNVTGVIRSGCVVNGEIYLSVASRYTVGNGLEIPILLKLDESLGQVNMMQLSQPVLLDCFNQLCATNDGRYIFWLASSQTDRIAVTNAAFYNATRILLIDTVNFTISDSVLLPGVIASKAVSRNDNSCLVITDPWWISFKSPLVEVDVTPLGKLQIGNGYLFDVLLEDIEVLQNGNIVVTGHRNNSNLRFIGLFSPNPVDANSLITTYESDGLENQRLFFTSNKNSLQNGQAWLMVHNHIHLFTFAMENDLVLRNYHKIVPPPAMPGVEYKIRRVCSNPDSKEFYMITVVADAYRGELLAVTDEYLNSCLFEKINTGFTLQKKNYPIWQEAIIAEPAPVLAFSASNIVSPSINITINNTVCPPIPQPNTTVRCTTALQQICWLTIAQHEYNATIPGQAAIAADHGAMVQAMQKTAQPIWRPNTKFYVHFALKDNVDNGGATSQTFHYYYGFKTTGPVGHYTPPGAGINHPLTSLRQYIDYNRSYPNADGNLLQAKPLFYGHEQCKISIFFAYAFAYHMLQKWYAYNGMPELSGEMHIAIKDPVTDVVIPYPLPANWTSETVPLPAAGEVWQGDNDPRIPHNIQMLNNMINYINQHNDHIHCTLTIGAPIKPKAYTYSVTLTNLAPQKLYTALLYNAFEEQSDNVLSSTLVHEFVFQTSRYANFAEQVNSFVLKDDVNNQKQAVFKIPVTVTAANVNTAYNITSNQPDPQSDALQAKYAHLFDRVTEGLFGFKPNDPAVTTEFNLLNNTITGDLIGILIRNPEPFNIPKIPVGEIQGTITVLGQNGLPDADYKVLYSKDYAEALIMHTTKKITATALVFQFIYKTWNGTAYLPASTIITPPVALNI